MQLPPSPIAYVPQSSTSNSPFDDNIDLRQLVGRIKRGRIQIFAFSVVGIVAGICMILLTTPWRDSVTGTRVSFAFDGLERGQYPDQSKFQGEDLRAPDVVHEALRRRNLDSSEAMQTRVRAALNIEGIIPAEVTKQRDRLRASGQAVAVYIPDEYSLCLLLPRSFPLGKTERERLLADVVDAFREKFLRTHGTLPNSVGNAFVSLEGADYYEYELILKQDIQNTIEFLRTQIEKERTFRSAVTNLSFADLLKEAQVFSQVRLFDALGQIYATGLSRDRKTAMIKIDYSLRIVDDRLNEAVEQEGVVKALLSQTQERGQSYVLGLKSQAADQRVGAPVVDQGLIDSLLAHDAYNFLIRDALETGRRVKSLGAEHDQLLDRRRLIETFMQQDPVKQAADIERVQKALLELRSAYTRLMDDIRRTRDDYTRQKFADVVRISGAVATESFAKVFAVAAGIGGMVGVLLGAALSLLEVYFGAPNRVS